MSRSSRSSSYISFLLVLFMATIEELLKMSHQQLAALSEDQLREELKEAINQEPKANPVPLTDNIETSYTKEEDDNPIKLRKPRTKTTKKSAAETLVEAMKFLGEV